MPFLVRLLAAHRHRIGTPEHSRVLSPFRQAVLVLRRFRDHAGVHSPALDAEIPQAAGHRYLREGIDILTAHAPGVPTVLESCRTRGMAYVILGGTLIAYDQVCGTTERGNDVHVSGDTKRFTGNVHVVTAADGTPLWASPVEPGSVRT